VGDQAIGDVGAEDALLLTALDDLAHHLDVADEMVMGELGKELGALAELGLDEHGNVAVNAVALKMELGDVLQLVAGIVEGLELFGDLLVEALERGINGGAEDVVFALEVEVNGSIRYAGTGSDGADGGVEVAALGDDLDGGVQDAMVFQAAGTSGGDIS
jgi:hypothetical protein